MKHFKSLAIMLAAATVGGMALTSCHDDDTTVVEEDTTVYQAALAKLYPDVQQVQWETRTPYTVANFKRGFTEYDVWFDSTPSVAMTVMDYGKNIFMVPDNAVTAAFPRGQYGMWTIDEIEHYKQRDAEFYVFEVETQGQPATNLYYATDGTLIKTVAADQDIDITPDTVIAQ